MSDNVNVDIQKAIKDNLSSENNEWKEVVELFHNGDLIAVFPAEGFKTIRDIHLFGNNTQIVRDKRMKIKIDSSIEPTECGLYESDSEIVKAAIEILYNFLKSKEKD
jgi:hypothetical protein